MNSPEENAGWFVAHTRRRGVVCRSALIRDLRTGSENPSLLATRSGFPFFVPRCLGKQGGEMLDKGLDAIRNGLAAALVNVLCQFAVKRRRSRA